ncbi:MAG: class I adenylate-forming enzyme family protein [Kiritimatiellae bacterium]|jgi:long-chain acyl-CoA synthetase|nr:class I adenylate-forming enzyme family protein [Kiritimatiellia bacterium]
MTLRGLLDNAVSKWPSCVAIKYKRQGEWCELCYADLVKGVEQMAEVFADLGIRPGKDNVAVMLDNGPEWIESYFALAGCGVTVVPIDPKLRPAEVLYILNDSGAALLLAHKKHIDLITEIAADLPDLRCVVIVDDFNDAPQNSLELPLYKYEELRDKVRDRTDLSWYRSHKPAEQEIASIIYTSGTMGKPKGAMLSHNNFCSDTTGSLAAIDHMLTNEDDFLVVLPFFHSFSFTANLLIAIANGSGLFLVENLRTVSQDIKTLRPTILMAVPLLVEKMFHKIDSKVQGNAFTRWVVKLGLGPLIGSRIRKALGGRLRYIITGGAPCPVGIIKGFKQLGICVVEGYGLTECSPVVSFPKLTHSKIGTIGRKLPNIEVRLADQNEQGVGELQIRGPIVMKGYYKNIEATRDAFDGEWLKTGDLAIMDDDGYISICGRKKALIVNREGKNIYPEEVENAIARDPLLQDVVVIGYRVGDDPGERIGVIIALDSDLLVDEFEGNSEDCGEVESFVKNRLMQQCEQLSQYKHPRKIEVRLESLERTSVQKVRRCLYQGLLDESVGKNGSDGR